ncbi:unnamed protein product [Rotaria magnacalcarata]|uniref:Uncharacterized protein n=1 Tax=Rotaria magnacalcarata TaxID=392030 RepID=A0A820H2D2_9BILA|nr:unnamed protein product [Rotaria magnacalcarata]
MAQYDRCSTTNGCACFLIAGATNFGLCSYQYLVECSQLTPCENSTNLCPRDYECVHHPRCHDVPICYPVRADNAELCPPILVFDPENFQFLNIVEDFKNFSVDTPYLKDSRQCTTHIQSDTLANISRNPHEFLLGL